MNIAHKLAVIAAHKPYREALLRHRCAGSVEHVPVLRAGQYRTVVDIGANHGQFAFAARQILPEATIISFEPLAAPCERYRRVHGADPRVVLHCVAIGAGESSEIMHVSKMDHSSSLLPIGRGQVEMFPGTGEVGTEAVRVVPLANCISPDDLGAPALLKLDVQGYELEALKGCEDLLPHFDAILVEASFVELYEGQALAGEVIAWLQERGYLLGGVHNVTYDRRRRAVQADFLFSPKARADDGEGSLGA